MSRSLSNSGQGSGATPALAREPGETRSRGFIGSLSILQVHLLLLTLVLGASGLVPVEDLTFVVFISVYIVVLNKIAFPRFSSGLAPISFQRSRLFLNYVTLGAVVGLVLPVGYILASLSSGDKKAIRAASPHLFLLSCQVLTENFAASSTLSLMSRVFVPIAYNTRRLFTISEWVKTELSKDVRDLKPVVENASVPQHAGAWISFGQNLAVANMVFWGYNLFAFLLPVYLPKAMRAHFEAEASVKQNHKTEVVFASQ